MASLDEFQVKLLRLLTCIQNPVSRRYFARHHKLPKEWSDIMARKNWNTLSETTLQVGAAALEFVRMYNATNLGQKGGRLAHGIFSQFCQQHVLLQEVHQHGRLGLCLGHATWAGLCWPVRSMDFGNPEVTCYVCIGLLHFGFTLSILFPCGDLWAHVCHGPGWCRAIAEVFLWEFCSGKKNWSSKITTPW